MRKVGFIISKKENEKRKAIILNDIKKIKHKECLYFEKGYGRDLGFSDRDLIEVGCNVVEKNEILNCDIICDPKIGDSKELTEIKNKIIFGWVHATQNYDITQTCIDNKLTVYAWEKMYDEKRHIFERNNQIAGEAAVIHVMSLYGSTLENMKVAILGNGNTSRGVQRILNMFNINYKVYTRSEEETFKNEFQNYDILINCILWDTNRKDHIIYADDILKMKKGSLIIDVSCDKCGGIETSTPTTIDNPIYEKNGVIHYVVDHTPSILYKDATNSISTEVCKFIDDLIEEKENLILFNALVIKDGKVIDNDINIFQNRKD